MTLLKLEDVTDALAAGGWRGFTLLRRYLAAHPREALSVGRRLRAVSWDRRPDLAERAVRFVLLAEGSTANLEDPLLVECLCRGIVPAVRRAGSGPMAREIGDPASALWAEAADVVVVVGPSDPSAADDTDGWEERFLAGLVRDLRAVREGTDALLLVHGFPPPERRPLGLRDWGHPRGLSEAFARLNLELSRACGGIGAHVVDVGRAVAEAGARWWTLHRSRFIGGLAVPEDLAPALCREYAAAGAALRGLARKCLVLDLDDTLWGGIVGEVGPAELAVGDGYPGSIYREIQRTVRGLGESGVVLALNSANDEADAWAAFERPEMVLSRDHFAAWRVNWQDKAANLRSLSEELGLGLESFVVLDDDAVTRGWIEESLPEVHVIPAGDPLEMLHALATTRLFETLGGTTEDEGRGRSYAAAGRRRREEGAAADREAFLAGLELVVTAGRATAEQLPRLAQLTQRTNQFNLTTRRYTHAQLERVRSEAGWEVLSAACRDRFADEGVVGLVLLRTSEPEWTIDTFALSCRVLRRGVERALAAAACRMAVAAGATALKGEYVPSARNGQVEHFYRDLGFSPLGSGGEGRWWRLALPPPEDLAPSWIRLERPEAAEPAPWA